MADRTSEALARIQEVCARDHGRLVQAANRILGDPHAAEDAVQEAWLRLTRPDVLARLETGDPARLRGLVLITVQNAARNLRRARRDETQDETVWATLPDGGPTPTETAERRDAVRLVRRALAQLEETDREILLLEYDNRCTSRQIAALLGLQPTTVRKRASRARAQLKEILKGEDLL